MNLIIIVHNQLVVLSLTSVTLVLIYVHTRISVQWDLRDLRKLVSLRYLMQTTCRKDLKNIMFYHTINIKHEFVLSGKTQKKLGVRTMDIAKRLLDFGFHPPTVYFPLNVEEAMMI